ncbi:MAG: GNAT family N-acetyltransferase [Bryobacteraceae bacterium]|nr:GNAT family N-acetyltransferase [Bryobacteraceae bacterium]
MNRLLKRAEAPSSGNLTGFVSGCQWDIAETTRYSPAKVRVHWTMHGLEIRRLRAGEEELARKLFQVFADVFETDHEELPPEYVAGLLRRDDLWVLAALAGDQIAGGITAHTLPMTRSQESELFIYDLAVRADLRRKGIGRALVTSLVHAARAEEIRTALIPVEPEDTDAVDFYRAIGGRESDVKMFLFVG